jgi:hypothetical protein
MIFVLSLLCLLTFIFGVLLMQQLTQLLDLIGTTHGKLDVLIASQANSVPAAALQPAIDGVQALHDKIVAATPV